MVLSVPVSLCIPVCVWCGSDSRLCASHTVAASPDVYESLYVTLACDAAAYRCFTLVMQRVGLRFNRVSEKGIQQCLLRLRQLIEYLDPQLFNALRKKVR